MTDVIDRCLADTRAERFSPRAREVALIAVACAMPDRKAWRRQITANYKLRNPECGSVFLIVILPILISLISAWLSRWIFREPAAVLAMLKAQAMNELD